VLGFIPEIQKGWLWQIYICISCFSSMTEFWNYLVCNIFWCHSKLLFNTIL
jgi:hypothetical protein